MSVVTLQVGRTCSGGGHVEILTLIDGKVTSSEWHEAPEIIKGKPVVLDPASAKDKILSETSGADLVEFKAAVEAKTAVIPDQPKDTPADAGDAEVIK